MATPKIPRFESKSDHVEESWKDQLSDIDTKKLLTEINSRGGVIAAYAEAALLFIEKSEDYNGASKDDGNVSTKPDEYFPFGLVSYAHMLHLKAQRIVNLTKASMKPKDHEVHTDVIRRSVLDLINYSAFAAEWLLRNKKV